jgi:hypothetical protein
MRCARKAVRSTPRASTAPWPNRRPRRAPPGRAPANRPMPRSGTTWPKSMARPSSSATTPKRRRAWSWRWSRAGRAPTPRRRATRCTIVVNQTPFYAEAGGQVGDTGTLKTETGTATITDTRKVAGVFLHMAEVAEGEIAPGQPAVLEVDHARRGTIRANHSATHLLHEALRRALGDHVAQRGSLNAPDRLRFDFSHAKALTPEEYAQVERDGGERFHPPERAGGDPDHDAGRRARDRGAGAFRREIRRRGPGRVDGHARRGRARAATGRPIRWSFAAARMCGRPAISASSRSPGDRASSAGVRRIEALTGAGRDDHAARTRHGALPRGRSAARAGRGGSRAHRPVDGRPQAAGKRGRATAAATGAGGWRQAGRAGGGEGGRRAFPRAGAGRRQRQGPRRPDRRAQGPHGFGRRAADRGRGRQGCRCGGRDGGPDREGLRRGPRPRGGGTSSAARAAAAAPISRRAAARTPPPPRMPSRPPKPF